MDKTNYLSQTGSDIFELSTSNLDLGSSDFLETKKRGRQQRGADGKFESLMKDNLTDFNGPTFNITNSKQNTNMDRGLMSLG